MILCRSNAASILPRKRERHGNHGLPFPLSREPSPIIAICVNAAWRLFRKTFFNLKCSIVSFSWITWAFMLLLLESHCVLVEHLRTSEKLTSCTNFIKSCWFSTLPSWEGRDPYISPLWTGKCGPEKCSLSCYNEKFELRHKDQELEPLRRKVGVVAEEKLHQYCL